MGEDPLLVPHRCGLAVSSRGAGGGSSAAIVFGGQDFTLWILVGTQTLLAFPLFLAEPM